MATSIKRVIIIMLFMNLLIVLTTGIAINIADETSSSEITNSANWIENYTNDFNSQYTQNNPDSQVVQLDKSYGDVKFGQKKIFEILSSGVTYPFTYSCGDIDCTSTYQTNIQLFIKIFLGIINALALIDIVFIAYSKKYD